MAVLVKTRGKWDAAVDGEHPRSCWGTPGPLYGALKAEFPFTLDGAAAAENALCGEFLGRAGRPAVDGVARSGDRPQRVCIGEAFGFVPRRGEVIFLNPPYGGRKCGERPLREWVDLAFGWSAAGAWVVLVLPSDTGTEWFKRLWAGADEIRFLSPRVGFVKDGKLEETCGRGGAGSGDPRTAGGKRGSGNTGPTLVGVLRPGGLPARPLRAWVWAWEEGAEGPGAEGIGTVGTTGTTGTGAGVLEEVDCG